MAKSEELDWLMGPPSLKFGDIKEKIWDYVSPGDTIYITGTIELVEGDGDFGEGIYLENEPVTVTIKDELKSYNKRYFYVTFGKNITDTQIWSDSISGDELDIGSVASDDELLITLPNKSINESNEFDWTDDFQWTTDMLYSMLENCNEIKVSNYNLETEYPYTSAGGPIIYTLTRCKEWWDRFSAIKKIRGRGPAEWYDDYDEGRIGVISAYGPKYKNIRDINWEDVDSRGGWTVSQEPHQIVNSLNGKGSELFILLDDKGRPVYDLIPKEHRERIKTNWEDRFYGKNINESDEDPLKWIKDVKTNQDIAKEIYDGLKWSKEGNIYYVRNQWRPSVRYLVRPFEKGRDKIILHPSSFHINYRKYMIENWGIYEMENAKEIYWSVRKLIAQKIHNNLNESELSWIEGIKPEFNATMLRYGQKFKNNWGGVIRTIMFIEQDDPEVSYEKPMTGLTFKILDDPSGYIPYPSKPKDDPLNSELFMNPIEFDEGLKSGQYVPIFKDESFKLKESKDLDWIKDIEAKGLNKNNGYVVDVRNLKPAPMRFSHDPTLTRQDILRKLEDFGYNIYNAGVDTDRAAFLYLETSDREDVGNWVEYDEDDIKDPTYGGKYQMIGVDELMFLLDNNLISESELDWLQNMGEPMSICEAYPQVKVGDTIIVNSLEAWEDSPDEELFDVNNATATVLAVDKCKEIQPNNTSTDPTILVHFNEPYTGFDGLWVRDFKPEYREACMDGRCMFLICEDEGFYNDVKITNLGSSILGENKKPINEAAGISFEARKWGETIYNEIMNNPDEKKRLIIDGYDHPEAFNGFPIDYVVIDFYDRLTGYGQEHSGYDKDGNYVVLLYIQPKLLQGQGGYNLKSVLNHEMKHAWEDYNRLSKGLPSIEHTKESQELYNRDFILMLSDQNITGPIKEILKYYYYLSNLEKSAYLENVYDQNPTYERVVREIARKDFESFKDRHDLDINWHLMNTAYDIPFLKKFKSPREFIDYSAEELRSKAVKMTKKINKMRYIHGK